MYERARDLEETNEDSEFNPIMKFLSKSVYFWSGFFSPWGMCEERK
jgi:hypothetical protein